MPSASGFHPVPADEAGVLLAAGREQQVAI